MSPKWIQTALSFKTSELDVGCHLLTAEVFKRKMCELERYECGNVVITCALVVDQKGFGHLLNRWPWDLSEWQLNQNISRPMLSYNIIFMIRNVI